MIDPISAEECADVLRAYIEHRDHAFQNLYFVEPDGEEFKFNPSMDILTNALRFALTCVEEKIKK